MIRSFKDLEVYKESYELAIIVNKLCNNLPLYEKNDLGSANEMEVHLSMAKDLGYLEKDLCDDLITRYIALGGKLTNLRNKWKSY